MAELTGEEKDGVPEKDGCTLSTAAAVAKEIRVWSMHFGLLKTQTTM